MFYAFRLNTEEGYNFKMQVKRFEPDTSIVELKYCLLWTQH